MKEFRSGFVNRSRHYQLITAEKFQFYVKCTLGIDSSPSEFFVQRTPLKHYNGIFLSEQGFYPIWPLPEEWMEDLSALEGKSPSPKKAGRVIKVTDSTEIQPNMSVQIEKPAILKNQSNISSTVVEPSSKGMVKRVRPFSGKVKATH